MTFESLAGQSNSEVRPTEFPKEEDKGWLPLSWLVPVAGKGLVMANQSLSQQKLCQGWKLNPDKIRPNRRWKC